jgi:hypothetical protein
MKNIHKIKFLIGLKGSGDELVSLMERWGRQTLISAAGNRHVKCFSK